jgi:4-amino-4-deoxy-L-arabinose transferase-like glycosyltransferase
VLIHILVYAFPFTLIFMRSLFKEVKLVTGILVTLIASVVIGLAFKGERFPIGNMFLNMHIGTETFYESLHPWYQSPHEHNYSETFESIAIVIKYVFGAAVLISAMLVLIRLVKTRRNPLTGNPVLIFLCSLFSLYTFLVFVPDSYADRYHLPLIITGLVLFSFATIGRKMDYALAIAPILLYMYISVFGTKDYLELNRNRWEAYHYLKDTLKVDRTQVNGGFEVNCWNEGEYAYVYQFLDLHNYTYLIQYRHQKGFKVLREYEFQRYFPYKKDKIYIFVREDEKTKGI